MSEYRTVTLLVAAIHPPPGDQFPICLQEAKPVEGDGGWKLDRWRQIFSDRNINKLLYYNQM